ncbi:MAG: hypothetical protein IKV90_10065 [Clostridia bacterium]|nr:hypothetical protein [Clostridia bacterium]
MPKSLFIIDSAAASREEIGEPVPSSPASPFGASERSTEPLGIKRKQ